MGAISKCCSYYCTALLILSFVFYALILVLEKTHNEYLLTKYQEGDHAEERVSSIYRVFFFNLFLLFICLILIKV